MDFPGNLYNTGNDLLFQDELLDFIRANSTGTSWYTANIHRAWGDDWIVDNPDTVLEPGLIVRAVYTSYQSSGDPYVVVGYCWILERMLLSELHDLLRYGNIGTRRADVFLINGIEFNMAIRFESYNAPHSSGIMTFTGSPGYNSNSGGINFSSSAQVDVLSAIAGNAPHGSKKALVAARNAGSLYVKYKDIFKFTGEAWVDPTPVAIYDGQEVSIYEDTEAVAISTFYEGQEGYVLKVTGGHSLASITALRYGDLVRLSVLPVQAWSVIQVGSDMIQYNQTSELDEMVFRVEDDFTMTFQDVYIMNLTIEHPYTVGDVVSNGELLFYASDDAITSDPLNATTEWIPLNGLRDSDNFVWKQYIDTAGVVSWTKLNPPIT